MTDYFDAHYLSGFDQLLYRLDIFAAGFPRAARVFMRHDDRKLFGLVGKRYNEAFKRLRALCPKNNDL